MVEGDVFDCEEHSTRHADLGNELELPMVSIRESTDFVKDDLVIFPPINHENLYIDEFNFKSSESSSSLRLSESSSSSSSSSSSPSDSDEQFEFDRKSHSQPSETIGESRWKSIFEIDLIYGWWKLLLARALSNFKTLVTCFPRYSLCSLSKTLRSFYPVMVIVIGWWMRNRTRRRHRKGEIIAAHLRDTIKERDERIAQLLHQIAQMNELLVKITHSN